MISFHSCIENPSVKPTPRSTLFKSNGLNVLGSQAMKVGQGQDDLLQIRQFVGEVRFSLGRLRLSGFFDQLGAECGFKGCIGHCVFEDPQTLVAHDFRQFVPDEFSNLEPVTEHA